MNDIVYMFRMLSGEEESFIRDFEILADLTFYDLHLAIQEELGYDTSQMASFFLASETWDKQNEITLFDMKEEKNSEAIIMDKAKIGTFITETKQKLLYQFDFFSDRYLYIEMVDSGKRDMDTNYPVCTRSGGKVPRQIIIEDNNIDDFSLEEFDDLSTIDDDINFENIDDYEEF